MWISWYEYEMLELEREEAHIEWYLLERERRKRGRRA